MAQSPVGSAAPLQKAHRLPPLRITTCGSVDDGKSTLIGRLLYDTGSIPVDQLEAIQRASLARGQSEPDLSLLTDGLRAEREQGITIDVAYRYFSRPRRRFIVADAPGHTQYTRNMATAASVADLAIVLIDARHGITVQTRRHVLIATLLRVPKLVVAVNKVDLLDDPQTIFERLRTEVQSLAPHSAGLEVLPISALNGDNVAARSPRLAWFNGPTLLEILESYEPNESPGLATEEGHEHEFSNGAGLRVSVQSVIRPGNGSDGALRSYGALVLAGELRVGQEVEVLPSGLRTSIKSLALGDRPLERAGVSRAVTVALTEEIDVARGDLFVAGPRPTVSDRAVADVVWFDKQPLKSGARVLLKQGPRILRAIIDRIEHRVDLLTLSPAAPAGQADQPTQPNHAGQTGQATAENHHSRPASLDLHENDVGRVHLRTSGPMVFDPYAINRATGSFILIDPITTGTVGGGMLVEPIEETQ